jgi:hypothetical protein
MPGFVEKNCVTFLDRFLPALHLHLELNPRGVQA